MNPPKFDGPRGFRQLTFSLPFPQVACE